MMDLGEEEDFMSYIDMSHVNSTKDFYMTGNYVTFDGDSLRTYCVQN